MMKRPRAAAERETTNPAEPSRKAQKRAADRGFNARFAPETAFPPAGLATNKRRVL